MQVLQIGYVLYASNVRKAIKRKEEDLLEAQIALSLAQAEVQREKKKTWDPILKELKVRVKAQASLRKRWLIVC